MIHILSSSTSPPSPPRVSFEKTDKNATLHVSSIYCYKQFFFLLVPFTFGGRSTAQNILTVFLDLTIAYASEPF